MSKTVFVSWMPYNWRSQVLAEAIRAQSHFIHYLKFKRVRYAPLKYLLQFFKTFSTLNSEKPATIVVATPPVFAAIAVYLYARFTQKPFIIDAHTGSFLDPKWRWSRGVHAFLSRQAAYTIVTNDHLAQVVSGEWQGKVLVVPGTIPDLEDASGRELSSIPMSDKLNVAVPCSFSNDEPISEILDAARNLVNQVTFYLTGDSENADSQLISGRSNNVVLTGFLPREDFSALLHSVDAIMALTKRDHTLQLGGYEAVAVEKPLVTSDWDILRRYFSQGTLYTGNTPNDIRAKLCLLLDEGTRKRLSSEMEELKRVRMREWKEQAEDLRGILEGGV